MPSESHSRLFRRSWQARALAVTAGIILSACGGSRDADKPASQTAAKVNKEEITIHQINALLAQQRLAPGDSSEAASRRQLERLIDQELTIQKAAEMKVEREPRVVQALEAARRDIIARAYAEKISESAAKPTPAEIKAYYQSHPALFAERRVYQLQEFAIEAPASQADALRAKVKAAKGVQDFAQQLNADGFKFATNRAIRAAEQLPMLALPELSRMTEGQGLLMANGKGVNVTYVVATRSQPVSEERAAALIEQFLLNERRRKLVNEDLKSLRAAAKIEYVGSFAGARPADEAASAAPSMAAAIASAAAGFGNTDEVILRPRTAAASAVQAIEAAVPSASAADAASIKKGLGLK
jgi:EpsD family peptidyl-prolyl cis-trans isomerase